MPGTETPAAPSHPVEWNEGHKTLEILIAILQENPCVIHYSHNWPPWSATATYDCVLFLHGGKLLLVHSGPVRVAIGDGSHCAC